MSVKFLTAGRFAEAIGVHINTVRKWDKTNRLKPHHTTPGGTRMYSQEQVDAYLKNNMQAANPHPKNDVDPD